MNLVLLLTEFSLPVFGISSQESPERGGWAYSLGLVFCIWKVLWWVYYSSSDCRKEERMPDGPWNSAGATSAAPTPGPRTYGKDWGPPRDSPGLVLTVSEESIRDPRTGKD